MRILVVEDNHRLAALIRAGLAEHGIRCQPAASLADADALVDETDFDAIILDLNLPDGDGQAGYGGALVSSAFHRCWC